MGETQYLTIGVRIQYLTMRQDSEEIRMANMNPIVPEPAPLGNQRAVKHNDMKVAEVFAMRAAWGIGYTQISYLAEVPRKTVQDWLGGKARQRLTSSQEFLQIQEVIQNGLAGKPPARRKSVQQAASAAREHARLERQDRLKAGRIEHTPALSNAERLQIQRETLRQTVQQQVMSPRDKLQAELDSKGFKHPKWVHDDLGAGALDSVRQYLTKLG